jgi:hypothetical protein
VSRPPKADWNKKVHEYEVFEQCLIDVWPRVCELLVKAQTADDVRSALSPLSYGENPIPLHRFWELILRGDDIVVAVQSKKFPKTQKGAQIRFIAKFLACGGKVGARTFDRQYSRRRKAPPSFTP